MLGLRLRTAALALGSIFALLGCSRVHLGSHDGGGGVQCGSVVCDPGQVCCSESCGICGPPEGVCPAIDCLPPECFSDAECAPGQYCAWPDGVCAGPGTCTAWPDACPPVIRETCGCDGVTYASSCDAAASGVSVLHDGPCETTPCAPHDAMGSGACELWLGVRWNGSGCEPLSGCECIGADCSSLYLDVESCQAAYAHCTPGACMTNEECGPGQYCRFEVGECARMGGAVGTCRPTPGEIACPFDAPPVCGCDGVTYGCEGAANRVGVSVLHEGACSGICAAMDAVGFGDCALFFGFKWNGGSCEGVGGCECVSVDCEHLYPGEDSCLIAHAGCERMPGGDCGGFIGSVCRPDEWCDFTEPHFCGGGDEGGVCRSRPTACTDVIIPVCGCDGTIYDNDCLANASGWDTWSDPAMGCGTPPPSP